MLLQVVRAAHHMGVETYLIPAPRAHRCPLEMERELRDELVGSVHRLIESHLLPSRDPVDRESGGLVIHRRGADAPVDELGLNRPVPRQLVLRTGSQRPS